jgi:hypothetical protein
MNKKLLFSVTKKDLEITWFSGTGKGGSSIQQADRHYSQPCTLNHQTH